MSQEFAKARVLPSKQPRKILIIDDEADIREVAAIALEVIAGWQVSEASSGAEGVKVAREKKPDAILLDAQMPEMDGPATLRLLRADAELSAIPVLFLTAKVQNADRKTLSGIGAAAVLSKPFDPLSLAHQIASALGWS